MPQCSYRVILASRLVEQTEAYSMNNITRYGILWRYYPLANVRTVVPPYTEYKRYLSINTLMTGKALKECCFRWRCWSPASRKNTTYGVPADAGEAVAR